MKTASTHPLNIRFSIGSKNFDIFFRFKNGEGSYSAEADIALRLLPAMLRPENIDLAAQTIDPLFLNALADIQCIYHHWKPVYNVIQIQRNRQGLPEVSESAPTTNKRVATFFSGGVDSFYTLIKHRPEITDLIFVHGLDIPLENTDLRTQTVGALTDIAKAFNVNLLEVETNLKTELFQYGEWGTILHGIALASVGLVLQSTFSTIYIPASHDYANLFPWGSHPLLDHLWSTSRLRFIHDGAEATRPQKVERIATQKKALEHLRVCWKNTGGTYNCCKCEKCLRTMLNLYICGKLEDSPTFPEPLRAERVAKMKLKDMNTRNFARENIARLEHMPGATELTRALKRALRRSLVKKLIKRSYRQ